MFPRERTGEQPDRDPSADPLGINMHPKEAPADYVPSAAPVGYVRAYDEGRPKH